MLTERKKKKDHNGLWHYRNSYNAKFRVVAVFKQPQRVVACEDMPWCESRVVAVKGNDHNEFGSGSCGTYSKDSEDVGLKVSCNLCVRKNRINFEREGVKSDQEQHAQKMFFLSSSWYWDKRCGLMEDVYVLAVVIDVSSSGLYLLGTKEGLLERLHARNEFMTADNNFIEDHDRPSSVSRNNVWK